VTPGERIATIEAWIKDIGSPMKADVEGLKRAFWLVSGGSGVVGVALGLIAPAILKKLGIS